MKKQYIFAFILVLLVAVLAFRQVSFEQVRATFDQCQNIDKYVTKEGDSTSEEVNFDFQSSDNVVVITADAGYTITEVWLNVQDDNHGGFFQYGTTAGTYNPNPGGDITVAKVRVIKLCPSNTPTNTPTTEPTVTPTDDPTPTPTEEVTPTPTEEVTPTPTEEPTVTPTEEPRVTPTPTEQPKEEKKDEPLTNNTTSTPRCENGDTINVPANPHVYRNGESATVNFFITEGDSANIYWSEVGQPHWQHAVANVTPNGERFVSYTIHGLNPNAGYDFGVEQKYGCGGGETITAVIVDGPEPVLFHFSYWEWNK